jgi:acetyl esterase/lipase
VIAIEPAADLAGIWADHSVPGDGTPFPEAYIGGPPSEYPSRYFIDSPIKWVDEHVPPTLIVAAGNDHLILAPRTADLAHGLAAAGNDCRIVTVPFAEHGIAAGPDDYGEQVEEQLIPRYVAALEAQEATSGVVSIGKACE